MADAEQTQLLPSIVNRTLPVRWTTGPPPVHDAPVPPLPGLARGTNLPSLVRTKSRGLAFAIRSAVQYLMIRSCSAFALVEESPAATGATASGNSARTVSRAAATADFDRCIEMGPPGFAR